MSGMTVERRLQVLMTFFSFAAFSASTFFKRWASMSGPFLRLRDILYLPPRAASTATTNNQLVRWLRQACTTFGLAPRGDRVASTGRLAFATTEWVVDRVHGDTTRLGADALPAVASGLADRGEFVLGVADGAERRATVDRYAAHLGRRQSKRGVGALFGDDLHAHTGAARHLAAAPRAQFDVVHRGTGRDEAHRQRVAGADVGLGTGFDHVVDLEAVGREDVALLAVEVVQERDATGAVRV